MYQGVQHSQVLVLNFLAILRLNYFTLVVTICDLVHDVETIHGLCKLLTASGNLF